MNELVLLLASSLSTMLALAAAREWRRVVACMMREASLEQQAVRQYHGFRSYLWHYVVDSNSRKVLS